MPRGPLKEKRVVPKIPCRECGAVVVSVRNNSSGLCRPCLCDERGKMYRSRYTVESPRPRGQDVDATCYKCKKPWRCPPSRHPKYSICHDCRLINEELSAVEWVDARAYVPSMGR